jgi:hypothetical protein
MALGGKNIDVSALDTLSPEDASALEIDHLCEFQDTIEEAEALWKARKNALQTALDKRFSEDAAKLRLADKKDTGTVHIKAGELQVDCELQKRVEWDQDKMVAIRDRIARGGGDPFAYIRRKYDMTETAYNALQPEVKAVFVDARTVNTAKPKYTITDPKAAKAKRSRRAAT